MTTRAAEPGDFPVRPIGTDDWTAFLETDSVAFGASMPAELQELERELFEADRCIGAFDGATPVGIAAAYSFDLSVPGAVLPAAGISWVAVLPTHRRRGVLREHTAQMVAARPSRSSVSQQPRMLSMSIQTESSPVSSRSRTSTACCSSTTRREHSRMP